MSQSFARFFICFLAVVFVAGCQQTTNRAPVRHAGVVTPAHKPAYERDNSKGSILYEQREGDAKEAVDLSDPLVAHMMARKAVDPVHVSKRNAYVKRLDEASNVPPAQPAVPKQATRNVRIDAAPVVKPTQKPQRSSVPAPGVKPALKVSHSSGFKTTPKTEMRSALQIPRSDIAAIKNVRLGEHPGKTRIVLDVSKDVDFETWFQDKQHVLVMNIPQSHIDGAQNKVLSNHPFIKAYGFKSDGQGTSQFIMTFKKPAQISYKATLKPNNTYRDYRVVLDVKA